MKTFKDFIEKYIVEISDKDCTIYNQQQLKDLEKFADNLLKKFDIDIEFSKHFGERLSDSRNTPCIAIAELQQFFKKIQKDKGQKIKQHQDGEKVLIDIQKELNIPIVIRIDDNNEFELTLKTIMRKKDFKSPDEKITY